MSNPHIPLDPDPLNPADVDEAIGAAYVQGFRKGWQAERPPNDRRTIAVIAVTVALVLVAFAVGRASAAPRSAPQQPVQAGRAFAEGPTSVPTPSPEDETAMEAGIASWYWDGPGLYAAVPSWRFGDARYSLRVCRADASRCVTVQVRDFCGCPGARVIDLSREAFARLAPLSAGLVRVTIESPGVSITPPPTETEP